jgi:hypothetical protein
MTSTGAKVAKHFADVMTKVYKLCFSSAITELNVNIVAEKEIVLKDVVFSGTFEAKNACEVDNNYKVLSTTPFSTAMKDRLDAKMLPGNVTNIQFDNDKKKVFAVIDRFTSIEILSKCLAVAVSSITLRLNAVKTVKITNLQVDQAARAVILSCVQNTRVEINGRSKTMAQHIDDLDLASKVEPVDPEEEEEAEQTAEENLKEFNEFLKNWGARKPKCGKDNPEKIAIATSVGMVGIIIMIIVLIVVAQNKKKLAKP